VDDAAGDAHDAVLAASTRQPVGEPRPDRDFEAQRPSRCTSTRKERLATTRAGCSRPRRRLRRPARLREELRGVDLKGELRHYTLAQFWVFVPFLFVWFELSGR
jgi:hypothetical protein